jgi:hypothetical protein
MVKHETELHKMDSLPGVSRMRHDATVTELPIAVK